MNFDVCIVDISTPRPYDLMTLDTEPLGGTEATVLRVAKALTEHGLRVAVVEHNLQEPMLDGAVFFLPISYLSKIDTKNLISLRSTFGSELFPRAKKFSWHQDVPDSRILAMKDKMVTRDITVIGVSRWHKGQLSRWLHAEHDLKHIPITYIYNACPDELYIDKDAVVPYNKNKLVWLASPHKGLTQAVELFSRLRSIVGPQLELDVFNPGYMLTEQHHKEGVNVRGPLSCNRLWEEVKNSLCVFYPTSFQETFGCIAAESNALHTPIATNEVAALAETVAGRHQMSDPNDYPGLLKKVESWYNGNRPDVFGQDRFRTSVVIKEWLKLLSL